MKPILRPARIAAAVVLSLAGSVAIAASGEFTFVTGEVSVLKANGQRVTPSRMEHNSRRIPQPTRERKQFQRLPVRRISSAKRSV